MVFEVFFELFVWKLNKSSIDFYFHFFFHKWSLWTLPLFYYIYILSYFLRINTPIWSRYQERLGTKISSPFLVDIDCWRLTQMFFPLIYSFSWVSLWENNCLSIDLFRTIPIHPSHIQQHTPNFSLFRLPFHVFFQVIVLTSLHSNDVTTCRASRSAVLFAFFFSYPFSRFIFVFLFTVRNEIFCY